MRVTGWIAVAVMVVGCEKQEPKPEPTTAPAAAPVTVTLGYQLPKVGDTWTESETTTMSNTGPDGPQSMTATRARSVEVLEVSDKAVIRAIYAYTAPELLAGKSYVLDSTNGKVDVLGSNVLAKPDEVRAVLAAEKHFGQPDALERTLAGRVFEVGKPVALSAAELAKVQQERPQDEPYDQVSLTLVEAAGGVATFDVTLGSSQPDGTAAILTGRLKVDVATGTNLDAALHGSVTFSDGTRTNLEIVAHRD